MLYLRNAWFCRPSLIVGYVYSTATVALPKLDLRSGSPSSNVDANKHISPQNTTTTKLEAQSGNHCLQLGKQQSPYPYEQRFQHIKSSKIRCVYEPLTFWPTAYSLTYRESMLMVCKALTFILQNSLKKYERISELSMCVCCCYKFQWIVYFCWCVLYQIMSFSFHH